MRKLGRRKGLRETERAVPEMLARCSVHARTRSANGLRESKADGELRHSSVGGRGAVAGYL